MAESLAELRGLTEAEVVRRYDEHAPSTGIGTGHYLG